MPTESERLRRIDARRKTVIECEWILDVAKESAKAAREALKDALAMLGHEIDGNAEDCPLFGEQEDEEEDSFVRVAV